MFKTNEIEKIIKRKNKALAVFEETKTNLLQVVDSLKVQVEKGRKKVEELNQEISAEHAQIELANREISASLGTVEKINNLIQ